MKKLIAIILIIILTSCSRETEVTNNLIRKVRVSDGREFSVMRNDSEEVITEYSTELIVNKRLLTLYYNSDYYYMFEGQEMSYSSIASEVEFNFDYLDMLLIDYDYEHVLASKGNDNKVLINGNEDYLEYETISTMITSNGDLITYEKLILEDYYELPEITLELSGPTTMYFTMDDEGEIYLVGKITTLTTHPLFTKVTVNNTTYIGEDSLYAQDLTYERLKQLGVDVFQTVYYIEYEKSYTYGYNKMPQ